MMSRGDSVKAILAALKGHPMTRAELCLVTGLPPAKAASLLAGLRRPTTRPAGPKRVHIVRWTFEFADDLRYPRAVYAVGDRGDARKPKRADMKRAAVRRYMARKRGYEGRRPAVLINSVFALAQSLR